MNVQLHVLTKRLSRTSLISFSRCLGTPSSQTSPNLNGPSPGTNQPKSHGRQISLLQKRILVFTGHFKKIEDVPENLPESKLEKANGIFRLYVATALMVITAFGFLIFIIGGKSSAHTLEKAAAEHRQTPVKY